MVVQNPERCKLILFQSGVVNLFSITAFDPHSISDRTQQADGGDDGEDVVGPDGRPKEEVGGTLRIP